MQKKVEAEEGLKQYVSFVASLLKWAGLMQFKGAVPNAIVQGRS